MWRDEFEDTLRAVEGLRVGVFEFCLRAETAAYLPAFKGSTLRGAFGAALKRAVCIRADRNCEFCLVRPSCAYTHVFETLPPAGLTPFNGQKYAPHPYVLDPPATDQERYAPGDALAFGLTLIGRALDYLPYAIYAVDQAGRVGLGRGRGRFMLEAVYVRGTDGEARMIYDGAAQRLAAGRFDLDLPEHLRRRAASLEASLDGTGSGPVRLRLTFTTPVRLRVRGDLQAELAFDLLARSLLRRLWQLALVHGGGSFPLDHRAWIARAQAVTVVANGLRWVDWERYSQRQQARMKLGGLVGTVEYGFESAAERAAFLPLLVIGKLMHVGAGTTFGLGGFEISG